MICYDISDEKSFQAVNYWINQMNNNTEQEHFVMALAGNKCDVSEEKKKISLAMAKETATTNGMIFRETSAKEGTGVSSLFQEVAKKIL